MHIRRIAVIGGGTMGQGIMHVAGQSGFNILLKEVSDAAIERALAGVGAEIDDEIVKWGHTVKEKEAILAKIQPVKSLNELSDVDLIIEAIQEDLESKVELFQELNQVCNASTIFGTNTSTLSISNLAAESGRPERFIGIHFHAPVYRRPIVEVVRGLETSDETVRAVKNFSYEIGKTAIEVYEWPGYVTTRMMIPLINEAVYALMEGVASAQDIDKAMELGCGMQMGPLQYADAMGLDTVVFQMEHLFRELGDVKYRPCPLLKKMIRAGHLGVKSGKGFFEYARPEAARVKLSVIT